MNKLIIIGNGFDISCGLKTRYQDFFQFQLDHNKEYMLYYLGLRNLDKFHFENWGGRPIEEIKKKLNPLTSNLTIIDCVFLLLEWRREFSPQDLLWCDVETILFETLRITEDRTLFSWQGVYNFLSQVREYGKMVDSLIFNCGINERIMGSYLLTCDAFVNFINRYQFSISNFYSFLYSQLKLFEYRFAEYIQAMQNDCTDYFTKSNELLVKISSNVSVDIDSFNYTEFPIKGCFSNIHGRASKNAIIFGISNYVDHNNAIYQFTKESRQCDLLASNISPSNGTKLYDEIFIYGHSLNKQDCNYFYSLFDRHKFNDVSQCKTTIQFCYSLYNKENTDRIKQDYVDSVKKLVVSYAMKRNLPNLLSTLINAGMISFKIII